MILIKLLTDLTCGVLNSLGGFCWLPARRFIMPFVIGVSFFLITHIWWTLFLPLPAMGTLCLGYSKDGNSGRGLWLFIQAGALSLGITLTGHIFYSWICFIPYVVLAGVLGGIYKNWPQTIGDLITGCYLGSILFLVR